MPTAPASPSPAPASASCASPRRTSPSTPPRSRRRSGRGRGCVLWNSPNNPAGKVFSREELETIAEVCVRHDLLAVTDEVYEHIVFEGEHIPLATLPGMRDRTVTISSAGKTFSFTGWKIGWTCAAPPLAAAVRAAHQFVTYAVATPFQHAMAAALGAAGDYYDELREGYRSRRDHLCAGLADIGFARRAAHGHLLRQRRHPTPRLRRRRGVLPDPPRAGRGGRRSP